MATGKIICIHAIDKKASVQFFFSNKNIVTFLPSSAYPCPVVEHYLSALFLSAVLALTVSLHSQTVSLHYSMNQPLNWSSTMD